MAARSIPAGVQAGPAVSVSFVVAGITCGLAALCYAEFASMVPVAGSAYTYAYATLGELFAWIIGWDLVLEYAVGSATVATGWSGYFQNVLAKVGIVLPATLRTSTWAFDQGRFAACFFPVFFADFLLSRVAAHMLSMRLG